MNIYDDYSDEAVGKALIERTISSYYDDELERVGVYKFAYCHNLSFFSCAKLSWIASSAFLGCSNLSTVVFPESICTGIETNAFKDTGLSEVSGCVYFNGYGTFEGCQNLKNVTIAISRASTQYQSFPTYSMPQKTFCDCINLESFSATYNGHVSFAGYSTSCFYNCQKLVLGSEYFQNVTGDIGAQAFYNCKSMSCVVSIPNPFTLQGASVFGNAGITGINMPKVQVSTYQSSLALSIFAGCSNLSFAYLDELSYIFPAMFRDCINLASVRFCSATLIREGAFSECKKLSLFVSPSTVSFISAAFAGVSDDFKLILKKDGVVSVPANFTSQFGLFGYDLYSKWKDRRIYVPDSRYEEYLSGKLGQLYSSILFSFSDLPSEYSSYLT